MKHVFREAQRAIAAAEKPEGVGIHDGKASIPASHLRWLVDAAKRAPEWIPVAERLPKIKEMCRGSGTGSSDPVLVLLDDEDSRGSTVAVWRCFRGGQGDTTSIHWDWDEPKVTHWMPLPSVRGAA